MQICDFEHLFKFKIIQDPDMKQGKLNKKCIRRPCTFAASHLPFYIVVLFTRKNTSTYCEISRCFPAAPELIITVIQLEKQPTDVRKFPSPKFLHFSVITAQL